MFETLKPLPPDAMADYAALRRAAPVPIAGGEVLTRWQAFQPWLEAGAFDIVQPDVCLCGGLLEMKKIAAMAEAHYVMVAPHNPMGPVATAVNVHFAASTPNFFILEYHPDDEAPRHQPALAPPGASA